MTWQELTDGQILTGGIPEFTREMFSTAQLSINYGVAKFNPHLHTLVVTELKEQNKGFDFEWWGSSTSPTPLDLWNPLFVFNSSHFLIDIWFWLCFKLFRIFHRCIKNLIDIINCTFKHKSKNVSNANETELDWTQMKIVWRVKLSVAWHLQKTWKFIIPEI